MLDGACSLPSGRGRRARALLRAPSVDPPAAGGELRSRTRRNPMRNIRHTLAATLASIGLATGGASLAASHREAPAIAGDPTADITDVYAFVSYDEPNLGRSQAERRVT